MKSAIPAFVFAILMAIVFVASAALAEQAPPPPAPLGDHTGPNDPHFTPPPPSSSAPPPAPPAPRMVPVSPHSPDDLSSFLRIYHAERTLADESSAYIRQAQQHLNEDKSKMDGLNQLLENELIDLHTKESWGSEVKFNPQTEKFEKPLPGPGGGTNPPAVRIEPLSSAPTAQPINKDTKPAAVPEKQP